MIMFTKFELETAIIMVLTFNNNKWFTKQCLFDEVSKYFQNNMEELYYGHFLFVWTKLLINNNFISVHPTKEKIKIKTNETQVCENFNANQVDVIQDMNIQVQLKHMIDYPKLYEESILIKDFLLQNYDCEIFFNFFNLYKKILVLQQIKYEPPSNQETFLNKLKIPISILSLVMFGCFYFRKK